MEGGGGVGVCARGKFFWGVGGGGWGGGGGQVRGLLSRRNQRRCSASERECRRTLTLIWISRVAGLRFWINLSVVFQLYDWSISNTIFETQ